MIHTLTRHMLARRLLVLLAALVAIAGFPVSAAADTPISHSGNRGAHALGDTPEYPGAICQYFDSGIYLRTIRVRQPHVEGYSWTSGSRDHQKVGWKFKILRSPNSSGGPYTTVYTSPLATAFTYDNQAASWPSRSYSFGGNAPMGWYTVDVLMYWYHPNTSALTGSATHRADWYRLKYPMSTSAISNPCGWAD